jgi:glutaredoxin
LANCPTHHVLFYTKPGCHLCENALALLHALQGDFAIHIEAINIEEDAALFKHYFDRIPVLVIDRRTTLAAPIRAEDVRAALSIGG